MTSFPVKGDRCHLRPWKKSDKESLLLVADDPQVARGLRDKFPSPYTPEDADFWLEFNQDLPAPAPFLAICLPNDQVVGGVGVELHQDEERFCADIGYWLGQAHWGQGIVTEAMHLFLPYVQQHWPHLVRLQAPIYAWNQGSRKVLLKLGFQEEGRLRAMYVKQGEIVDGIMFAKVLQ